MNHPQKMVFRLASIAAFLALAVVVLGAYVRLSHAGLGCPDWPGCYGHIGVPAEQPAVMAANQVYPEHPVVAHKAWKEMAHRYAASTLGFLILLITGISWYYRAQLNVVLPTSLLGVVILQGMLGMWTVTLLLKPLIVSLHLLGGMATLTLLFLLMLKSSGWQPQIRINISRHYLHLCLTVLIVQIALGGWVSSNYAALACYGFPQCNLQWVPEMNFSEAFVLWRGLGIDYEGGVLDHPARVAIHMAHRMGAGVVALLLVLLIVGIFRRATDTAAKRIAGLLALLLLLQLSLGIANVTLGLPLVVATAHNGVAALLLLTLVSVLYIVNRCDRE